LEEETTTQKLTKVQPLSTTPKIIFDGCEMIYGPCSCGVFIEDCLCQCTTIHESTDMPEIATEYTSTERTTPNTETKSGTKEGQTATIKTETTSRTNEKRETIIRESVLTTTNGVTDFLDNLNSLRPRPNYSTTTMTSCTNHCWCGYSNNYINNCKCDCSFALSETPHIILTWDKIASDLDLHVLDPNGEEISFSVSHTTSSSGGKFLRDATTGPNAVELISWGLIEDSIKGPNGNYTVYVEAFRTSGRTQYTLAVLESLDQD
jgi:hypothetical protein